MRRFGSGSSSPSPGSATSSGYEQWDGHGGPGRRAAPRRRDGASILADLDAVETWDAVVLAGGRFDAALAAVADFIDPRSPYSLGHARAVADLVAEAVGGLGADAARTLRAPTSCPASAGSGCRTRSSTSASRSAPASGGAPAPSARTSPSGCHRTPALAPLGAVAVKHRGRLDGFGSPCGLAGAAIARQARLLAAPDTYQAMREPRPQRAPPHAGLAAGRDRPG